MIKGGRTNAHEKEIGEPAYYDIIDMYYTDQNDPIIIIIIAICSRQNDHDTVSVT